VSFLLSQLGKLPQLSVRIDSKVLLDNIADALNTIDLAVALGWRSETVGPVA